MMKIGWFAALLIATGISNAAYYAYRAYHEKLEHDERIAKIKAGSKDD